MSRRALVSGSVVAAICAGTLAWISVNGQPELPSPAATVKPVLTVSVIAAEHKTLDDNIQVLGTTVPREDVVVIPELTGLRISEVYAELGDYVKKGQKLALLDSESLQIQLQGLQTEFERTRDEYTRVQTIQPSGLVSKESVAQRRAAYELARSRLQDAELNIHRTQIVAPTNGLIYEKNASIGGLVNGNELLFRLAKDGEVEMEASVPEAMLRRLRPSMPVILEMAGNSAPLIGNVRFITPRVDNTSRAAGVRISFKRAGVTPVGVFCEARITVAQVSGWVLPSTALQQDTQGLYVWYVNSESTVMRKPVTVVLRTPDRVVVREMLDDASIVAKAGSFLKEGDLVALAQGE